MPERRVLIDEKVLPSHKPPNNDTVLHFSSYLPRTGSTC